MGEGEERLLEIALANITIHAVSLYQVVCAELPEPARTHGGLPSFLLRPYRGVPALSVFTVARLKFFHFDTEYRHTQIPQDNERHSSAYP